MTFIDWIMDVLGISELEAILLFEGALLLLFLIAGYFGAKNYEKLMGLKQENEKSLPDTIHNDYSETQKMIMKHNDPKFSQLPLYAQIKRLHQEQRTTNSKQLLIDIESISYDNLPSEIVSNIDDVCLICKSKLYSNEAFGYYVCCYEMSHLAHVKIWHHRSKKCPFCRQQADFKLIITNTKSK